MPGICPRRSTEAFERQLMKDDPFVPEGEEGAHAAFDARMRAAMAQAMPLGEVPAGLLRGEHRWRRPLAAVCGIVLVGLGALADLALQPPVLVQAALAHEHNERSLRGNFMPDGVSLASFFGLPSASAAPGLLQMAKPCVIAGRVAYHDLARRC